MPLIYDQWHLEDFSNGEFFASSDHRLLSVIVDALSTFTGEGSSAIQGQKTIAGPEPSRLRDFGCYIFFQPHGKGSQPVELDITVPTVKLFVHNYATFFA